MVALGAKDMKYLEKVLMMNLDSQWRLTMMLTTLLLEPDIMILRLRREMLDMSESSSGAKVYTLRLGRILMECEVKRMGQGNIMWEISLAIPLH